MQESLSLHEYFKTYSHWIRRWKRVSELMLSHTLHLQHGLYELQCSRAYNVCQKAQIGFLDHSWVIGHITLELFKQLINKCCSIITFQYNRLCKILFVLTPWTLDGSITTPSLFPSSNQLWYSMARCRVEKSLLWENTRFLAAISSSLRHGRLR